MNDIADTWPPRLVRILTATGANGCVLDRESALVNHSGTSAELGGCYFADQLAAAIPGTLTVALYQLVCE